MLVPLHAGTYLRNSIYFDTEHGNLSGEPVKNENNLHLL